MTISRCIDCGRTFTMIRNDQFLCGQCILRRHRAMRDTDDEGDTEYEPESGWKLFLIIIAFISLIGYLIIESLKP